jgi:arylformamidase
VTTESRQSVAIQSMIEMKIIDLSYPIHEGMTTFPVHWHPIVEVTQMGRHGIENRETRRLTIGTHCGTHIDAPRHFIPNASTVDQIPLEWLVGPARLVNMTPVTRPKQEYGIDFFKRALRADRPSRLIMRFDWSDFWGTSKFYSDQPYITEEAAHWLVEIGVQLIAMDTPQLDSPDNGRTSKSDSPIHKIMLAAKVVFVEYCRNLRLITKPDIELIVLPLNILGSDGAPARVIAIQHR